MSWRKAKWAIGMLTISAATAIGNINVVKAKDSLRKSLPSQVQQALTLEDSVQAKKSYIRAQVSNTIETPVEAVLREESRSYKHIDLNQAATELEKEIATYDSLVREQRQVGADVEKQADTYKKTKRTYSILASALEVPATVGGLAGLLLLWEIAAEGLKRKRRQAKISKAIKYAVGKENSRFRGKTFFYDSPATRTYYVDANQDGKIDLIYRRDTYLEEYQKTDGVIKTRRRIRSEVFITPKDFLFDLDVSVYLEAKKAGRNAAGEFPVVR